jgi:hypothetical protein
MLWTLVVQHSWKRRLQVAVGNLNESANYLIKTNQNKTLVVSCAPATDVVCTASIFERLQY